MTVTTAVTCHALGHGKVRRTYERTNERDVRVLQNTGETKHHLSRTCHPTLWKTMRRRSRA